MHVTLSKPQIIHRHGIDMRHTPPIESDCHLIPKATDSDHFPAGFRQARLLRIKPDMAQKKDREQNHTREKNEKNKTSTTVHGESLTRPRQRRRSQNKPKTLEPEPEPEPEPEITSIQPLDWGHRTQWEDADTFSAGSLG